MNKPEPKSEKRWWRIPPLGVFTLAAFAVCVLTGIMLVPAFKPGAAMDSLALLLLKNPNGIFVRSLHYWSAQAFLVLTLVHVFEHLIQRSETKVSFGVWLRLCLALPLVVGAMLSGFLLRADAASIQAMQILRALLGFVPLVGMVLVRLLTGSGTDLLTVYLHHACTATLLIWLVTVDHSRRILPNTRHLFGTLAFILPLSVLLVPGLEWRASAVEKGPWYLIGLQEMLHWLPQPRIAVWLALTGLLLLILLPKFSFRLRSRIKWALTGAALIYVSLTVVGVAFRGEGWKLKFSITAPAYAATFLYRKAYLRPDATLIEKTVPLVNGRREGCLACHQGMDGFAAAHDPKTMGCEACHLGNPFTLNKAQAHEGMTLTPGNLSVASQTCGTSNCHREVAARVHGSLMNSMSGVVAVDKYVFGESHDLDARFKVAELEHSPADKHLRGLCASCHLGQEKSQPEVVNDESRGGGCSACHLHYSTEAAADLGRKAGLSAPLHHPEISIKVRKDACFGCHSRSGRISTSYEGWHETLLDESSAKTKSGWPSQFRLLSDGRVFEKHSADVHFQKGMGCIDCHLAAEVMGDGSTHSHEEEAVKISCVDCHQTKAPVVKEFAQLDAETQEIAAMRKLNEPGRKFVLTQSGSAAYPNLFLGNDGHLQLKLIETEGVLQPKPAATACSASVHQRLKCGACHTAWAPQCIQCHTSFSSSAQGWDHLAGKFVKGTWQEESADYLSDAPALGIERIAAEYGASREQVTTFVPGMILNLDLPDGSKQFHRYFAPASPHTTMTRARSCRSCHTDSSALGYGRGKLNYEVQNGAGTWHFTSAFPASLRDGLPLDAWVGFLQEPPTGSTTRKGARPFSLQEQQRILFVGACLECHSEKAPRVAAVFANFKNYRVSLSPRCILPRWAGPG